MAVVVRQAGIDEIDRLMAWRLEVLREVFSLSERDDLDALDRENRAYYARELPRKGHIACFAEIDGQVIGCGGVCLQREMPSPDNLSGKCAYLMNIYTRPEAQRCGVGHSVVRWLVARARQWGAEKIYLETSKEGRALYEGVGFVDLPDMMLLAGGCQLSRCPQVPPQ